VARSCDSSAGQEHSRNVQAQEACVASYRIRCVEDESGQPLGIEEGRTTAQGREEEWFLCEHPLCRHNNLSAC